MNLRWPPLCLVVALVAAGCAINPVTGEKELSFVSNDQELQLGNRMHPSVIYEYDGEYHDPELKRYLGSIVLRLHRVSHRADQPVDFKVLNSSIFNAFAIPGHVYVTRGFLARLNNEAEFAAVMGHEMAHYTARHSARQLTSNRIVGLGLGLLTAALPEDSLSGQIAVGAGSLGVKLAMLRYGRSQEEQADRVGTYYLYRAGYEPTRALDMQKLLHRLGGASESSSFLTEYFSTHPTEETRLRRINEVIGEMKLDDRRYKSGDGTFAERWDRRLAPLRQAQKAYDVFDRAEVLARKGHHGDALTLCRKAQSMAANQAPFFRLEGDILRGMKQHAGARKAYARALAIDQRYLPAARGLGAVSLATADHRGAAKHFRHCLRLMPGYLDGHYGLGLSAFALKQYPEAASQFEAVVENVDHPGALSYLGRCYEQTGHADRAIAAYRACVNAADEKWATSKAVQIARERLGVLQPAP